MVNAQQLESTLQTLWYELAANPRSRALVIARTVSVHGDEGLKRQFAAKLAAATPLCDELTQALHTIESSLTTPHIRQFEIPVTKPNVKQVTTEPLRVDPELGRLSIALQLASIFRVWVIARELVRGEQGAGKLKKRHIFEALGSYGLSYTKTHFDRLIKAGMGIFWNSDRKTLYFRSPQFVAVQLIRKAAGSAATSTNRPGVRDVYLPVTGSLEQWEAMIYAGWLSYRNNPTISREVLSKLFGRSADTLRRWEENRLSNIVTKRTNYAQCPDHTGELFDYIPDHAQAYLANRRANGQRIEEVRLYWRIPNTYQVTGIREHPRKGQARKVRKLVNDELEQPADIRRGGLPSSKLYFDDTKHLLAYNKKHGVKLRYLWRGENLYQKGMFEPTLTGYGETFARERASFKKEKKYFARLKERRKSL